ncbi:MAG: hypothetical protein ABI278_00475 [Candidatus Aquilonibacter sp.]
MQSAPSPIQQQSSSLQSPMMDDQPARPMFTVIRYNGPMLLPATGGLPSWTGSFTHTGTKYTYTMVGANPAMSNVATTVPVTVIPLKFTIGTTSFSPEKKLPNGNTIIQNVIASPIFQSSVDFKQGGTDLGKTQYEDAFQRGNFWKSVKTKTGYHLMLKPTIAAVQTLKPPAASGKIGTEFGVKVGLIDIQYVDGQLNSLIAKLKIPAGTLPLFIAGDVYETQGGCCIGGYHSFNGTNTYSLADYIDKAGAFSQDVSALSHELGEWVDDPFTNNNVACGILEVGDPLEGEKNYGGYPYPTNGFTYNLQDLVFLPYFGAPANTSVNNWSTFQGTKLSFCQNGG